MRNFRYRLVDVDYILSEEEHEKVKEFVAKGNNNIFLRGGSLMINMSFVRSINETDELTDMQLAERSKILKLEQGNLSEEREKGRVFLQNTHNEFYERMKWN
jgi:hypothetical protein